VQLSSSSQLQALNHHLCRSLLPHQQQPVLQVLLVVLLCPLQLTVLVLLAGGRLLPGRQQPVQLQPAQCSPGCSQAGSLVLTQLGVLQPRPAGRARKKATGRGNRSGSAS
jgi:hypothetical protein